MGIDIHTQARLDRAVMARQQEVHERREVCRRESPGGMIRVKYQFPSECWFNAKKAGAPMKDPDYLEFEARRNPEFRAQYEDGKPRISMAARTRAKIRNRFGVVSFSKSYG